MQLQCISDEQRDPLKINALPWQWTRKQTMFDDSAPSQFPPSLYRPILNPISIPLREVERLIK
jgi:hypothetical protein